MCRYSGKNKEEEKMSVQSDLSVDYIPTHLNHLLSFSLRSFLILRSPKYRD
jgi:hypothetical protein